MESNMTAMFERIWKMQGGKGTFAEFMANYVELDEEARVRKSCEEYNQRPGSLGEYTGFNCKKCKNRGHFMVPMQHNGRWIEAQQFCDCWKARDSIERLKNSGLENSLRKLKEFEVTEDWQQGMVDSATAYLNADHSDGKTLMLCGAVGCGKTFIGSAVCRELLHKGYSVVYMPWVNEAQSLKALVNDPAFSDKIKPYTDCDYLFIDDLFKPMPGQSEPTPADFRLAYEIINYRYINKKPMIISCEKFIGELLEYDEGTISRLYEMAKGYTVNIGRVPGRNYRMKGADLGI